MEKRIAPARFAIACAGLLLAGSAAAQLLSSAAVAPANIKPGESARLTAQFDVLSGVNCGVRVHWGDGSTQDFKINQTKDVPLVASHAYGKPGSYKLKVEPKTLGITPKCGGDNKEAVLTVAAPAAAAPKTAASTATAEPCPAGWKLSKAGVSKKTGAFTCQAAANTKLPEARVACPGDLSYFENRKKGQLGCRV